MSGGEKWREEEQEEQESECQKSENEVSIVPFVLLGNVSGVSAAE